jgi:NAD(P)-dependent dehydrogenase (short-subunit alcohol dehydrogenase family)
VNADVSAESDVAALITGTVKRHGRLDCLVNSAGEAGIATLDLDRLQCTLAIHLGGAAAGMKHAAPVMAAQRSGSIINVASIGGHIAGCTFLGLLRGQGRHHPAHPLRRRRARRARVRVNSVSPGPILTGSFGKGVGLDPARADHDAARLDPVFRARLEAYQPIGRAGVPADRPGRGASRRRRGRAVFRPRQAAPGTREGELAAARQLAAGHGAASGDDEAVGHGRARGWASSGAGRPVEVGRVPGR